MTKFVAYTTPPASTTARHAATRDQAPARSTDLIGVGRALRRGKTLVNCDVDVVTPDGELVAKAIATYKVG